MNDESEAACLSFIIRHSSFIISFDPAVVPEREVEERPEVEAPVARAAAVLFEEARDELVIEEAAPPQRRVRHARLKLRRGAAAEPALDRRAEAALAPVEHVARQHPFER